MRLLITTVLLFLAVFVFGQQTDVAGSVSSEDGRPLPSITVTALRQPSKKSARFSLTDQKGNYQISLSDTGWYLIQLSGVGYQTKTGEAFYIGLDRTPIQLKMMTLVQASKNLTGVVVEAKKPLIEQKIDRTVVNVDASPVNVGSSALEVLEKSPGISVDKDGNISLKGKEGVLVLIDGRPTQLGAADLANMLRSLSATQLDQIEIMTNPPARFDAAGNAGIINIKTKKTKLMGYNGSATLSYGQGKYPKTSESLNMNYRQNKVNLFTNLSYNYRKSFQRLTIQRNFLDKASKDVISQFDQVARMLKVNESYNGKIGMDYFATKRTTIGVVLNGYYTPSDFQNRNLNNISDPHGNLKEQARALSLSDESWKNLSANLNFRTILDTAGKELTADLDRMKYRGEQFTSLSNFYYSPAGSELRKGDTLYGQLPQIIDITTFRADYSQALRKGARLEAGIKTSFVKTDNNAIYDTMYYGQVIRDKNRSNYFIYKENINAAYVSVSGKLSGKWSAQGGLRLENTRAEGNQMTTGENFVRNYTQLFPTAYLQYAADKKNTYVVNFGRRIRRPNYESLNPFIEYLDRYTSQQGNPNLKPQFSNNVELSHSFQGMITTTLNYSTTKDILQQIIEQNEATNETYVKQANIASQRQLGLSVSTNLKITKWWTGNLYANLSHNRFEGLANGEMVSIAATFLSINGSQQFKITKTLSGELSGWYRTKGIEGFMQSRAVGTLAFGLSQQVMQGKGSIRFSLRDIFYTQAFGAKVKYSTVDARFQERNDSRVATISFTYKFAKGKLGNAVKRQGSASADEQSRVGGGN